MTINKIITLKYMPNKITQRMFPSVSTAKLEQTDRVMLPICVALASLCGLFIPVLGSLAIAVMIMCQQNISSPKRKCLFVLMSCIFLSPIGIGGLAVVSTATAIINYTKLSDQDKKIFCRLVSLNNDPENVMQI